MNRMFFMHKEIYEEPKVITDTLNEVYNNYYKYNPLIRDSKNIYVVGSGTSFHASMYFEMLFKNAKAIQASEFTKRGLDINENTLVVGISQSGESVDTVNAVTYAKKFGAKILAITNTRDSTLYKIADQRILTKAGEERAVAATKSYIAQLVSIATLYSLYNKNHELLEEIKNLSMKVYEILSMEGLFRKYGQFLTEKIVVLGSGILFSTSLEASLKLKETANLLSEAYPSREFLHGPMQILDPQTTVIILGNSEDEIQVINKIKHYDSRLIRICEGCEINIPLTNELLKPILYIIPVQLIAFYKALAKGLNPDKPEKLVKVVRE
ncbi:hypothetical protein DJ528_08700 [Sulfolobus sp. B5]|nr:hypothetical protein DJ528_08700 [Sulfolobus sp. B5]